MKFILIILIALLFGNSIFAQKKWEKWTGHIVSYRISEEGNAAIAEERSDDFTAISQKLYKNIFSDYDGDNCAFYPSCSSFFVQAVHRSNFLKGSLLFIDRFTRDLNFAKKMNDYDVYADGHFYDPIDKYINRR